MKRLRLWFDLDIFTASDIEAIEPLPGTRVLITQTRKAGAIELDYESTNMSHTTYKPSPDDGGGLQRLT